MRNHVHFDLDSGRLAGAPEGTQNRAAYGQWILLLDENGIDRKHRPCVKKFSADIAPEAIETATT